MDTNNSSAIAAFDIPRATAMATRCSPAVSRSNCSVAFVRRSPGSVKRTINLRVIDGDRIGSPATTLRRDAMRSAGGVSLRRKPLAPACNERNTRSSVSKVVNMITCGGSAIERNAMVASSPLTFGIRMSISTTLAPVCCASAATVDPSAASPTMSMSGCPDSIVRRPARTSHSSSTSSRRMVDGAPVLTGCPLPMAGERSARSCAPRRHTTTRRRRE